MKLEDLFCECLEFGLVKILCIYSNLLTTFQSFAYGIPSSCFFPLLLLSWFTNIMKLATSKSTTSLFLFAYDLIWFRQSWLVPAFYLVLVFFCYTEKKWTCRFCFFSKTGWPYGRPYVSCVLLENVGNRCRICVTLRWTRWTVKETMHERLVRADDLIQFAPLVEYIQVICILTNGDVAMAEHEGKCGRGIRAKLVRAVDYAPDYSDSEEHGTGDHDNSVGSGRLWRLLRLQRPWRLYRLRRLLRLRRPWLLRWFRRLQRLCGLRRLRQLCGLRWLQQQRNQDPRHYSHGSLVAGTSSGCRNHLIVQLGKIGDHRWEYEFLHYPVVWIWACPCPQGHLALMAGKTLFIIKIRITSLVTEVIASVSNVPLSLLDYASLLPLGK